jgi:probable rRNA maturation factor
MLKIKFASPQEVVPIDHPRLKEVARTVLEGEGVTAAAVSLAFVDNATIHRLNKQFLNHDEPTDVISFPLSGRGAKTLEGEIVVGAEVARARATELQHDEQHELALYVIHGLLHLCGHDDTTDAAVRRMRARERHYLNLLGLPDIAEAD